jgi:hypothetical protein
VTVVELRKRAQVISESSVKGPKSIFRVAQRAIELRKSVTAYFLEEGRMAADRGHPAFIQTLQEICDLLKWEEAKVHKAKKSARASEDAATTENPAANAQPWMNHFAALSVEETEDIPEPATLSEDSDTIRVTTVEDGARDDEDEDHSHSFFRLMCLFHDLQSWRRFISQTVHLTIDNPLCGTNRWLTPYSGRNMPS